MTLSAYCDVLNSDFFSSRPVEHVVGDARDGLHEHGDPDAGERDERQHERR